MNKSVSISNLFLGIFNRFFKLTVIICFIIFLIIYYQSTLNDRYKYYPPSAENIDCIIFDKKKGEIYTLTSYDVGDKEKKYVWVSMSPFSKMETFDIDLNKE